MTYTLELLNGNRQLITLAQTTLEVIKEVRAPLITRFETNDPSRTLVDAGSTITLFWETDGATEVRLAPDPSFVGSLPDLNQLTLSGMIYAQPKQDTTYVLTAVNGPKVTSRQVRIRVSPAVTITRFDANPPATDAQGQTLLTWSAENCAQAELSGPRWQEQVPCAGSKAVTLSASATLTLKAWSAAGTFVSRDFSVLVAPPQPTIPRIDTFAASASRVPAGESLKLSWATSHAGRVQLRGLSSPQVAPQGSLTIKPKVTSTFTLEVYAAGASAPSQTWPLAIEVYRPELKINQFRASKNLVPLGSTVTLSWDIVACNSLQIYSLSVSSKKPIHTATGTCKGTFKASVKKGTTFRLVASGSSNTSRFADVVVLAGQDEVDGWFNMLKQVPND